MKYWLKLYQLLRAVAVIVADGVCKIMWKSVENWLRYQRKTGKNDQKNAHRDLWKRIIYSRFVAIATVLAFLSFFVWRLLTSESDVKSLQTVKIRCFTFPSKRGVSKKQSFLVLFQLGIISYKKKKKILGLCRCSVGNYSLTAGDLPCQFEQLSHTCTMRGTYSVLFQWRPAFSALRRRGKSVVSVHQINNFLNTWSNFTKFTGQSP